MKRIKRGGIATIVAGSLVLSVFGITGPQTAFAVVPPDRGLGAADSYSVFGKAGVTTTGVTHVWGNAGADSSVGLIASQVGGSINTGAGVAGVETDARSTFDSLMSATQGVPTGLDLAGTHTVANGNPITPGVYDVAASTMNGAVELSGAGVYIFRSSSTNTTAHSGTMSLINGATACNVFWAITDSMTIGTGAHVEGTIIAHNGLISLATGANLVGRAISLIAQVTLDANLITQPTCVGLPPPPGIPTGTGRGANYFAQLPLINVTKIPSPLSLPSGPGPVTYTYVVTNPGKVPMNTVWVVDNKCAPVQYVSGDTNGDGMLDLTETWTYNCFRTVAATETDTAIAHGYGVGLGIDVYDSANATVVVGLPLIPPLIHLVKVPSVSVLPASGGAVMYSYSVTNPGTVPLSDVSITDDKCTGLPGRVVGHPGDLNKNDLLDPGEAFQFTCQSNINQTTTNIGTAEGHANGFTAIDYSPATVLVTSPGLPNTGLPPREDSSWAAELATFFALAAVGLVIGFKKRQA